jgi:hypothetical protein
MYYDTCIVISREGRDMYDQQTSKRWTLRLFHCDNVEQLD